MVIGFGLWQGLQPMAPQVIGTRTVTVLPGQSVWAIAESVHPEIDPRITVDLIEEANGLRSASLVRPGAVLTVPVFERADGATRR
jgi:LysM repeat protein